MQILVAEHMFDSVDLPLKGKNSYPAFLNQLCYFSSVVWIVS